MSSRMTSLLSVREVIPLIMASGMRSRARILPSTVPVPTMISTVPTVSAEPTRESYSFLKVSSR